MMPAPTKELDSIPAGESKLQLDSNDHDTVINQATVFLANLKKYARKKSMPVTTVFLVMDRKALEMSLKEANQIIAGLLNIIEGD